MNDILKQRLVGALILVALGIVFWPIIFVQPAEETAGLQQPMPSRPGVSTQAVGAPDEAGLRGSVKRSVEGTAEVTAIGPIDDISDGEMNADPTASSPAVKEPTAAAVSTSGSTRSEAPEPLAIDSDGVPVAWILQVVSVSSKAQSGDAALTFGEHEHQGVCQKFEFGQQKAVSSIRRPQVRAGQARTAAGANRQ